ncbi:MAG TPA: site-specific integrase [Bacteroidales bacterium]|nr:site-specific integrase [Bacteroidales bacterium]
MVERVRFAIMFYIKRTKLTVRGECPVYVRLTVNGERIEFSMNETIPPKLWDSNTQRALISEKTGIELNESIQCVIDKLRNCKRTLEDSLKPVTARSVRNLYFDSDNTSVYLLDKFTEHNIRCEKLVDIDIRYGTLERYRTAYKHVQEFIKYKYGTADVLFSEVNYQFLRDFEFYLKTERKCANNTTMKYIRNFHKIIKIGLANNWIKEDPYASFKYRFQEVNTFFLDDDELERLMKKKFNIPRLELVKDTYVFCCFTGLAFSDVKTVTRNNLMSIDGITWLYKKRVKTDVESRIPLSAVPLKLIEKYKENPICIIKGTLLPVLSNQKMNAYLKEIADLCDIKKPLTTHSARHTFATTVTIANNMSIESVSKMLGHTSIKMTQRYSRIVDKLLKEDMQKLAGKYDY